MGTLAVAELGQGRARGVPLAARGGGKAHGGKIGLHSVAAQVVGVLESVAGGPEYLGLAAEDISRCASLFDR